MHDLNFFEGHIEKRELEADGKWIYIVVLGFFLIFSIGYITYNFLVIKEETKKISRLKEELDNPEIIKKAAEIKEKEIRKNEAEGSVAQLKTLDTDLTQRKKIDEMLLDEINKKMPNNIFLTSLNIEREAIYIEGISENQWAVAEFEKNLESLKDYDEIFVSYISLEEGSYKFALDITKEEGVGADEGTNKE